MDQYKGSLFQQWFTAIKRGWIPSEFLDFVQKLHGVSGIAMDRQRLKQQKRSDAVGISQPWVPSGKLTLLLKMVIYSEFSHSKWWFSIAMLVYQRVHMPIINPVGTLQGARLGSAGPTEWNRSTYNWNCTSKQRMIIISLGVSGHIWANENNSLTWNKVIFGMVPWIQFSWFQWGRTVKSL